MSEDLPAISVIIVSYNTRAMTLDCLHAAVAALGGEPAEILVVDNASQDGSVEAIRQAFPAVRLIANVENTGFGAANNQAMAEARGEFLLLLNSDAFPKPGAIAKLAAFLRANPRVGAVGARLLNADGSLQRSCWRFPSPGSAWVENLGLAGILRKIPSLDDYRRWDHATERRVDFVIGACMLVRRSVFEEVGGFDERFFMYAEESDWQRRMWDAGWEVAFTPEAEATHLGGASGGSEPARINRYFFESLDRYILKHHGGSGLVLLRAAMALGSLMRIPFFAAQAVRTSARRAAWSRVRLHGWLLWRQLFCWPASGTDARSRAAGATAVAIGSQPTPPS